MGFCHLTKQILLHPPAERKTFRAGIYNAHAHTAHPLSKRAHMAEGRSSEARDDEVLITRVSPPPPKRSKVDKEEVAELVYVDSEEPLRCSTPHDSIGEIVATCASHYSVTFWCVNS